MGRGRLQRSQAPQTFRLGKPASRCTGQSCTCWAPGGTTTSPPPVGLVTKEPVVVQPHSLELYFECFMELCLVYPECWHLLMPAEDRMRGERFEHLRRNLARAHAAGKVPVDIEYDPARGWSVPGSSKGSPILGRQRQKTRSGFLGTCWECSPAGTGTDVGRSEGFHQEHRDGNGSYRISTRGEEEEEEEKAKGWQRRVGRHRLKGREGDAGQQEAGRQAEQPRTSKEVGWDVPHNARGQASVLCLCKGIITRCMPWELQEWKGTQVHAVLGRPPEQGLPEEAGKSWWERRKEVGTRPRWRPRTCRQGGRRCESRRRGPSEVQVSRALCRLWGLHWGSEECMRQPG